MNHGSGPARSLVASVSIQAAAILPAFLVGSLAVELRNDLHLSESKLGTALALCFLVAAASSSWMGALTDRLGPVRTLRVASVLSAVSLLGLALAARSFPLLLVTLGISSVSLAVAGPATKVMVAVGVPAERQGLAFGLQAGAIPLASFLAGLGVSLAAWVGWRPTFAAAAVLPAVGFLTVPRFVASPVRRLAPAAGQSAARIDYRSLSVISAGVALGAAAATTVVSFFVVAATEVGIDGTTAGTLLAVGSGVVIVLRIFAGILGGRSEHDPLRAVVAMMAVSTIGYGFTSVDSTVVMPLAALFGLAFGWSWSGILVHAIVRECADTPGAATGMISAGQNLGGVFGPPAFGFCAEHVSYAAGFLLMASFAGSGAVCVLVGSRLLASRRSSTSTWGRMSKSAGRLKRTP